MERKSGVPPIPNEEIERLLNASAEIIQRYSAGIYVERGFLCSGVYAKSFGCEGIITAGHCAKDFMAAQHFGLVVSEEAHRFSVSTTACEHIPVGFDEIEGFSSDSPDLSFVLIRDKGLLEVLHNKGCEFYDLDNHKVKEVFSEVPPSFVWAVVGSPDNMVQETKIEVEGRQHTMILVPSTVIQGNLCGYEMKDKYDYVRILLGSGFEGFPDSYKGVSGGGIWFERFTCENGKDYAIEPILS